MKLLLVDNDRDLIEMLASWLKTVGYDVYRAYTLQQARRVWEEQEPDLVIIETGIEGGEGLAMCHDMCAIHDALVMALTLANDTQDEIRCLEAGVDDYLRKPFLPGQLIAHIRAVSRRARTSSAAIASSVITVGPIAIDAVNSTVTVDGKTEYLTTIEHKLLRFLAINANNVCTGDQIVSHVWGYNNDGDTKLIKAHIQHIRQKVEKDLNNPIYLLTVRGVGYSLVNRFAAEATSKEVARALPVAV